MSSIFFIFAVIGILLFVVRFCGIFILQKIIKIVFTDQLVKFEIDSWKFYPIFIIKNLHFQIKGTRSVPAVNLSLEALKISLHFRELLIAVVDGYWINNTTSKFIQVEILNFHIDCDGLRYKDFLNPSKSKKPIPDHLQQTSLQRTTFGDEIPKFGPEINRYRMVLSGKLSITSYMIQLLSILFQIKFINIDFNFIFPSHSSQIIGIADSLDIYCLSPTSSTTLESISVTMDFLKGSLNIFQNSVEAVNYNGDLAKLTVDAHTPSGMMKVLLKLMGSDRANVDLGAFMIFFSKYQTAEDDAIETKLARRLETRGKMYDICLLLEQMKVILTDKRSDVTCELCISNLKFQLLNYITTNQGFRYLRGLHHVFPYDANVFTSAKDGHLITKNGEKVIIIEVGFVNFPQNDFQSVPTSFVKSASLKKTLKVNNINDFIDDDLMIIDVELVEFHRVTKDLLDWLSILQETATNLASSRFAHVKKSLMKGHIHKAIVSSQPSAYSTPPTEEELEKDELVVIDVENLKPIKIARPYDLNSDIEVSADIVKIQSSLTLAGFSSRYNVNFFLHPNTMNNQDAFCYRTGMMWILTGVSGAMTIGLKTALKCINIQTGLDIKFCSFQPTLMDRVVLNPMEESENLSFFPFVRSNKFDCQWSINNDISCDLGEIEIKTTVGDMMKGLCSVGMIRSLVNRILANMARIKVLSRNDDTIIPPPAASSPTSSNSIKISKMNLYMKFAKFDQEMPSYFKTENIDESMMNLQILNFLFVTSSVKTQFSWDNLKLFLNNFMRRPAVECSEFSYSSITSLEANRKTLDIECQSMKMALLPFIEQGTSFSHLLGQYDAWKSGLGTVQELKEEPESLISNTIDDVCDLLDDDMEDLICNQVKELGSVTTSKFGEVVVVMDANFEGEFVENLLEIKWSNLDVVVDASLSTIEVHNEIAELDYGEQTDSDFDPSTFVIYQGVIGGHVSVTCSSLSIGCNPLENTTDILQMHSNGKLEKNVDLSYLSQSTLLIRDVVISGKLYLASASNSRIPSITDVTLCTAFDERIDPSFTMFAQTVKSIAPSKVYFGLDFKAFSLSYFNSISTLDCVQTCLLHLQKCTPPNMDPSPNLPFIDSLRYWLHGYIHIRISNMMISYELKDSRNSLCYLDMEFENFQLYINRNSVETSCLNFIVSFDVNKRRHLTKRESRNIEVERFLSSRSNWMKNSLKVISQRISSLALLEAPAFIMLFSHRPTSSSSTQSFQHHDVYLKHEEADYSTLFIPLKERYPRGFDKFRRFRSTNNSLRWEMEMFFADTPEEPILISLQLDALNQILECLSRKDIDLESRDLDKEVDEPKTLYQTHQPMMSTPKDSDELSGLKNEEFSLLGLANQFDVQLVLYNVYIMSWPSSASTGGIVFSQEKTDFQLRLKSEDTQNQSSSLKIHHMFTQFDLMDLYIRDWNMTSSGIQANNSKVMLPLSFEDLKDLMLPIYKVAHATKVEVSLTDDGDVSKRLSTFTNSELLSVLEGKGELNIHSLRDAIVLDTSRGSVKFVIGRNRKHHQREDFEREAVRNSPLLKRVIRRSYQRKSVSPAKSSLHSPLSIASPNNLFVSKFKRMSIESKSDLEDSPIKSFRPLLSSFASNHIAMTPPKSCLPPSYFGKRAVNSCSNSGPLFVSPLVSKSQRNTVKLSSAKPPTYHLDIPGVSQSKTPLLYPNSVTPVISSQGEKIWGIRVVDVRLLWTIEMRDILFAYVSRCFDYFMSQPKSPSKGKSHRDNKPRMYNESKPVSISTVHSNRSLNSPKRKQLSISPRPSNERVLSKKKGFVSELKQTFQLTSQKKGILATRKSKKWSSASSDNSISFKYFNVELVDPQLNFLDVKTHNSLIIVAGRSSLEGYKGNLAMIPLLASDELKRKNEIRLRMDGVSAFTVPTKSEDDSKVDSVHWKAMNTTNISIKDFNRTTNANIGVTEEDIGHIRTRRNTFITNVSESPNMKVAIKNFQIRASYSFWVNVLVVERENFKILKAQKELVGSFHLDLPEILVDTDSSQFHSLTAVITNVLLHPPPPLPKQLQEDLQENEKTRPKYIELSRDAELLSLHGVRPHHGALDIAKLSAREELKIIVEEGLCRIKEKESGIARQVEVFIGKGVWTLRSSDGVNLETGFSGVYATFHNHEDRSAAVVFEMQRFWARNLHNSLDDLSLAMRHPSTSIANANIINDKSTWIMFPIVSDAKELCVRCGESFNVEENTASSCTYHADDDGKFGKYEEVEFIDDVTGSLANVSMWTCCGRTNRDSPGCSARPHECKEIMITIRAEAKPTLKVENVEIAIINRFDISFFPGTPHDLQVRISKTLTDMLHKYFSLNASSVAEIEASENENKESEDATVRKPNERDEDTTTTANSSALTSTNASNSTIIGNVNRQECLYIKYMRVGELNVDVSTSEFPINISNYRAIVEAFVLSRGDIYDWSLLVTRYERHAMLSVTKNFATNSLNRIGKIFQLKENKPGNSTNSIRNARSFMSSLRWNTAVSDEDKRKKLLGLHKNK